MISFQIRNIKITADMGFLAMLAMISMNQSRFYMYAFLTCIIHELGHMIQIMITGGNIEKIAFNGSGIKIIPCKTRIFSVWNDISVLLGGSFVNIFTALILILLNHGQYNVFIYMNLILGILNLLPFRCLDGGTVILCLTEHFADYNKQLAIMKFLKIFNIMLCIILVFLFINFIMQNISAIVMIIYLIISEILK